MSEMVDRVAKAIVDRRREMWADKSGRIFVEPLELARAAIEAMREPTEGMMDAAGRATGYEETAAVIYHAMVDAALDRTPPPRIRTELIWTGAEPPPGFGSLAEPPK